MEIIMKCTDIKTQYEFSYISIIYCEIDVFPLTILLAKTLRLQMAENH
jgi:hypothetical protein